MGGSGGGGRDSVAGEIVHTQVDYHNMLLVVKGEGAALGRDDREAQK